MALFERDASVSIDNENVSIDDQSVSIDNENVSIDDQSVSIDDRKLELVSIKQQVTRLPVFIHLFYLFHLFQGPCRPGKIF